MSDFDVATDSEFRVIETFDASALIKSYKRQLGIDVSRFFAAKVEYREDKYSGIKYFSPQVCGDQQFYDDLQEFDWYYQEDKCEYKFAQKYTKGKVILDVGCGSGKFNALSMAAAYTGLELNSKAVKKGMSAGINVVNEDLASFSQSNQGAYDVVCLFQVVEHVLNPIEFLKLACNCIKQEGFLIVSVPSEDSFVGLARNSVLNMPPHHLTRWSDKALKKLSRELNMPLVGLRHERLEPAHYAWYTSVRGTEILNAIFRRKKCQLLDESLAGLFLGWAGSVLGKLLTNRIRSNPDEIKGHTVTMVLRKSG